MAELFSGLIITAQLVRSLSTILGMIVEIVLNPLLLDKKKNASFVPKSLVRIDDRFGFYRRGIYASVSEGSRS